MTRTVSVSTLVDVDVDLRDIETDDLVEELRARKEPLPPPLDPAERSNIFRRFFEERRRAATHGIPTEAEVQFWRHIHQEDL